MARQAPAAGNVSITDIQDGFPVQTLKVKTAQAYLSWHNLVDSGMKAELLCRVRDHLKFRKHGTLKDEYPRSSFTIPCNGAVCQGDVVLFKHFTDPLIAARVLSVSRQCRNFTAEVLWSEGTAPRPPFSTWKYLWRHVQELKLVRQPVHDEERRECEGRLNLSRVQQLAGGKEKEPKTTRKPKAAPAQSHNTSHDTSASVPDVLNFRDQGRGPSSAIVPCQNNHVAVKQTNSVGIPVRSTNEQGESQLYYTGRVLDFGQCESAVWSPDLRQKGKRNRDNRDASDEEDPGEMFSGRVLDFGGGAVVVEPARHVAQGAGEASSSDKRKKKGKDKENDADACAVAEAEPRHKKKKKRDRDQEQKSTSPREVFYVAGDDLAQSRNEASTSNAPPRSGGKKRMREKGNESRVIEFGVSDLDVVLDGKTRSQEQTQKQKSRTQDQDCEESTGKKGKKKARKVHKDENVETTALQTDGQSPGRSHQGILTVNDSNRICEPRKQTAPKSTMAYKKRPDWEQKWNPQCHVQCANADCKNNAPRRCPHRRCAFCCRCEVHKPKPKPG